MSIYLSEFQRLRSPLQGQNRQRIFVPYDQLTREIGPLKAANPADIAVVLIETTWKPRQRKYHKQKLAWILANQRHFALELLEARIYVDYLFGDDDYGALLRPIAKEYGPITMMKPAEFELRRVLTPLVEEELLDWLPHEGWLTSREDFQKSQKGKLPWRMDSFYRHLRKKTGYLMTAQGEPEGGQYSLDEENRKFWSGEPKAPQIPRFEPSEITKEVGVLIEEKFGDHPGFLDLTRVVATEAQARQFWEWAKKECMEHFGPFEDAMSTESRHLFHTLISPLLHLHRLLPREVLEEALELQIPLNSKEGFLRQVLGWREFMRHVYEETEGFEELPEGYKSNFLDVHYDLPQAYWGKESGLLCLDEVVDTVVTEGYSHHITRLMVLANLATLLDIEPGQISEWFWVMYIDAYDWVVEPNVLGMGVFALGDLFTTKPYVSGSNYIDKMSDYCKSCQFSPSKDCPIKDLYWAFLARHEEKLKAQGRMNLMLGMLRRRSETNRHDDALTFELVHQFLREERPLTPASLQEARDQKKDKTQESS